MLYNKNAGTNAWLYEADQTRQAFNDSTTHAGNVRLTWQASQRHKLNFYFDEQSSRTTTKAAARPRRRPKPPGPPTPIRST